MLLSFSSSLCARRVVYWRHRSSLSQNYRLFHAGNVLCRQLPKRELSEPEAKWKTPGVELPPLEEWWKIFRYSELRKRRTIKNPETAKMLAELYVPEGSKDKVIIEAWAGPGMLTRALLALPRERIRKIIVLEEVDVYNAWLKPLQELDDRIHVIEKDAFLWKSYTEIEQSGLMEDVDIIDWDAGVHPQLQYIAQIPNNVHGEQLIAQFSRAIPDRTWLYRYGRVPMDMITTLSMYERLTAGHDGDKARCKVGVMSQASADVTAPVPAEVFSPSTDHFFWPTARKPVRTVPEVPQQAVHVVPKEHGVIAPGELEAWDFVLRNLFIIKATPLKKSINGLGPGATSLLKKLADPSLPAEERVDPQTPPVRMSVNQWKKVVDAFVDWPFRPENLSITKSFHEDISALKKKPKKVLR